jgi:AbrB family looped-hinge helix DNA binding protein
MPTAMVTFNGRITLPPEVRKELGLKTGDNVDFVEVEKGRFAIRHQHSSDQTVQNELNSTFSKLCSEVPVQ